MPDCRKYPSVEISGMKEAKKALRHLPMSILFVALHLKNGNTVTVVDDKQKVEYVFRPKKADDLECSSIVPAGVRKDEQHDL